MYQKVYMIYCLYYLMVQCLSKFTPRDSCESIETHFRFKQHPFLVALPYPYVTYVFQKQKLFIYNLFPKAKSPASPRPGTMYA